MHVVLVSLFALFQIDKNNFPKILKNIRALLHPGSA